MLFNLKYKIKNGYWFSMLLKSQKTLIKIEVTSNHSRYKNKLRKSLLENVRCKIINI